MRFAPLAFPNSFNANFGELRKAEVQLPRIPRMRTSSNRVSRKFTEKLALMMVDTEPEEAVRCGIVSPRLPD